MNIVILSGNVCKDPEVYTTQGGVKRVNFTLAVQRRFTNQQGVREADFVPIVVWRQLAETVEKFVTKGMKLGIEGYLQKRDYETQDGAKRSVTEVIAENIEFLTPKAAEAHEKPVAQPDELQEEDDDDMPF